MSLKIASAPSGGPEPGPPLGPYKIMLARFPGQAQEHPASSTWCMKALLEMAFDERIGRDNIHLFWKADTPITMVRNQCVLEAQKLGIDYLLMIDADMAPDSLVGIEAGAKPFWRTAWELMLSRRHLSPCCIAAPYVGPSPEEVVYVAEFTDMNLGPDPIPRLGNIPRLAAAQRSGVQEVAALATGLMLIDMRVFGHLPQPWFDYEWEDKSQSRKATTEDYYFTRNCGFLGYPQIILWDCWADHLKTKACSKPRLLRPNLVHEELRKAMASRLSSDQTLQMGLSPDEAGYTPEERAEGAERLVKVLADTRYVRKEPA